jgi:hypothetical protein
MDEEFSLVESLSDVTPFDVLCVIVGGACAYVLVFYSLLWIGGVW